jgi:hypothetical protein
VVAIDATAPVATTPMTARRRARGKIFIPADQATAVPASITTASYENRNLDHTHTAIGPDMGVVERHPR